MDEQSSECSNQNTAVTYSGSTRNNDIQTNSNPNKETIQNYFDFDQTSSKF